MAEKDWSTMFDDQQFDNPWYTDPITTIVVPVIGVALYWLLYATGVFHTYW